MSIGTRFRERILELLNSHPLTLFIFMVLLISAYGNYQQAKQLDEVCELSGPHADVVAAPKTDREKLDNICSARDDEVDTGDDDDNTENNTATPNNTNNNDSQKK